MTKEKTSEVAQMIKDFNNEVKDWITGQTLGSIAHLTENGLIELVYGNKVYRFNPDGYNIIYNKKRLYNNEVVDALLE